MKSMKKAQADQSNAEAKSGAGGDWLMTLSVSTVPCERFYGPGEQPDPIKPDLQRVVSVNFLLAKKSQDAGGERYQVKRVHSVGSPSDGEADLLRNFWNAFEACSPRLVTWGGRRFDMQALKKRSLSHGLQAPQWHAAGDKWANYDHRFSSQWHCDLMDVWADHGAGTYLSLDEASRLVGLPGGVAGDGAEVRERVAEGDVESVRADGDLKAFDLFALYLRDRLFRAATDRDLHDASIDSLLAYAEANAEDSPHLARHVENWKASDAPVAVYVGRDRPAPRRATAKAADKPASAPSGSEGPSTGQGSGAPSEKADPFAPDQPDEAPTPPSDGPGKPDPAPGRGKAPFGDFF